MSFLAWQEAVADFLLALPPELRPSTKSYHACNLGTLLAWIKENPVAIGDFNRRDLNRYLSSRPLSENTLAHYRKSVKKLFAFLHEDGVVSVNRFADMKVPMPPEGEVYHPEASDLKKLLDAIRLHWAEPRKCGHVLMKPREKKFHFTRDYALIALLIETGCRIGEALSTTVPDFRLDGTEPCVIIRNQKGGGQRTLPLRSFSIEALQDYLRVRPKGTPNNPVAEELFLGVDGAPLSYRQANRRERLYRDKAGLPNCTLHSLRHYTLTAVAERDIFAAQQMGGHKDARVTRRYAHMKGSHLRVKHGEADPLGRVMSQTGVYVARSRKKRV